MSYRTDEIEEFALPLPIGQAATQTAQQFASQQPSPEKADQIRLNTLAVWVVNDYLQLMGIDTDLTAGDSWNPVVRLCADVADLEVVGVGRLECRPVTASQPTCAIPLEVWQDRIGYVVVQIDEAQQEAKILGFTLMPAVQVSLNHLRSPEDLLDRLYDLKQAAAPSSTTASVSLSQWLSGMFEAGWQSVESLLNPPQLAVQFRNAPTATPASDQPAIQRAKLIRLTDAATDESTIVLTLAVTPASSEPTSGLETDIRLQAHPLNQPYLPAGLQLQVLDQTGDVYLAATAREADSYLQLEFSGQLGESFSVQVQLAETQVTEHFVI